MISAPNAGRLHWWQLFCPTQQTISIAQIASTGFTAPFTASLYATCHQLGVTAAAPGCLWSSLALVQSLRFSNSFRTLIITQQQQCGFSGGCSTIWADHRIRTQQTFCMCSCVIGLEVLRLNLITVCNRVIVYISQGTHSNPLSYVPKDPQWPRATSN